MELSNQRLAGSDPPRSIARTIRRTSRPENERPDTASCHSLNRRAIVGSYRAAADGGPERARRPERGGFPPPSARAGLKARYPARPSRDDHRRTRSPLVTSHCRESDDGFEQRTSEKTAAMRGARETADVYERVWVTTLVDRHQRDPERCEEHRLSTRPVRLSALIGKPRTTDGVSRISDRTSDRYASSSDARCPGNTGLGDHERSGRALERRRRRDDGPDGWKSPALGRVCAD